MDWRLGVSVFLLVMALVIMLLVFDPNDTQDQTDSTEIDRELEWPSSQQ